LFLALNIDLRVAKFYWDNGKLECWDFQTPSIPIPASQVSNFEISYIESYFNENGLKMNLKYIDPSYIIKSIHANAAIAEFLKCLSGKQINPMLFIEVSIQEG